MDGTHKSVWLDGVIPILGTVYTVVGDIERCEYRLSFGVLLTRGCLYAMDRSDVVCTVDMGLLLWDGSRTMRIFTYAYYGVDVVAFPIYRGVVVETRVVGRGGDSVDAMGVPGYAVRYS